MPTLDFNDSRGGGEPTRVVPASFPDLGNGMPSDLSAAQQADLRAQAQATIAQGVIPAFAKLLNFMRNEYITYWRFSL